MLFRSLSRAAGAAAERAEWDNAEDLHRRLMSRLATDTANPLRLMLLATDPVIVRRNAEAFVAATVPLRRAIASPAVAKSRLKIGYISPDFRDHHPVATTVTDLFHHHDRAKFEIRAYAIGPQASGTQRDAIVAAVDDFTSLSELSDAEAAKRKIGRAHV